MSWLKQSMSKFCFVFGVGLLMFIGWNIQLANSAQSNIFFEWVSVIPFGDKLGHACLFGTLTGLFIWSSGFKKVRLPWFSIYWVVVVVVGVVTIEEFSQLVIESRSFDLLDLLADYTGIFMASVAADIKLRLSKSG